MKRLIKDESGMSLVELIAATALLSLALAAVLSLLDTTQTIAPEDQERAAALRDAQVGVHRMTRELRGAYQLETTSPYYLSARVVSRGVDLHVAYDCAGSAANSAWGQCVRTVLSGGSGGQPSPLVKAFKNKSGSGGSPVFTYTTRSDGKVTHVGVHLEVVVKERTNGRYRYSVPLDDGVYLRNLDDLTIE